MKTNNIYRGIALLAVALTATACQNELQEENTEPKPGEKIHMIIRATQGATPQTRTSYDDQLEMAGIKKMVVKWEGGKEDNAPQEKIKIIAYDTDSYSYSSFADFTSLPKTISKDGACIDFEGEITTNSYYEHLAIYPSTCTLDKRLFIASTSFEGQTQNCANPLAHLKDFDLMVGKSQKTGKYTNFLFEHKATMIRFVLDLPDTEVIKRVNLTSTKQLYSKMLTTVAKGKLTVEADKKNSLVPIISLAINGHVASSTPLKAYMMIPPFDASNDVLTITVNTESGTPYSGQITTLADNNLQAGLCYTLAPTLTASTTITVPPAEEGKLGDALNDLPIGNDVTELALTGTVSDDDLKALGSFMKPGGKGANISTLDLSSLTLPSTGTPEAPIVTVAGFEGCTSLAEVKLPTNVTVIGAAAFKGCTSLTSISQDKPSATTRASMPGQMTTIGESAFEGCTALTAMFLQASITSVEANAFKGCTALRALVFETDDTAANTITIGKNVITGTHKDLLIFMPKITNASNAKTNKNKLGNNITHYCFKNDYNNATEEDKVNPTLYKEFIKDDQGGIGDIIGGGDFK